MTNFADERFSGETSILLRYAGMFDVLGYSVGLTADELEPFSISEGARVLELAEYRGVRLLLNDETSLMATGTYKDIDACLTAAIMNAQGPRRAVITSAGNYGYALAKYTQKLSDLDIIFFLPRDTAYKMDGAAFEGGPISLILVDLPVQEAKSIAHAFAARYDLPRIPLIDWRLAASATRALHLLDWQQKSGTTVDIFAQTMSGGYGPSGILHCYRELIRRGLLRRSEVPRFLGFQLAGGTPMVDAWGAGHREARKPAPGAKPALIEPGLFNANPQRNYTRLFDLMRFLGGDMHSIATEDYEEHGERVIGWLKALGLEMTIAPSTGEYLEKTGMLTIVGVLKAIDAGHIGAGETVWCQMTGGCRQIERADALEPMAVVTSKNSEKEWIDMLGATLGLVA